MHSGEPPGNLKVTSLLFDAWYEVPGSHGLKPLGCQYMQMRQFWRPSAWADSLYAYTPWYRLLMGPCEAYIPDHIYFSTFRVMIFYAPLLSAILATIEIGPWLRCFAAIILVCLHPLISNNRVKAATQRNLTADDRDVSVNMPTLFAHLRQLSAARTIIREAIPQSCMQPVDSRVHNHETVVSSLALMQALGSHAKTCANLEARLQAAFMECTGRSLASVWGGQCLAEAGPAQVSKIQAHMQGHRDSFTMTRLVTELR